MALDGEEEILVVNEVLCFIANKISLMGVTSLLTLCENFYDEEAIENAKTTLQKYCKGEGIEWKRRNKGANKKNLILKDIIHALQCGDTGNVEFVAKSLNNLPPISFNDLDASSVLQTMTKLKEEVKTLNKAVDTQALVTDVLVAAHNAHQTQASAQSATETMPTDGKSIVSPNTCFGNTLPMPSTRRSFRDVLNDTTISVQKNVEKTKMKRSRVDTLTLPNRANNRSSADLEGGASAVHPLDPSAPPFSPDEGINSFIEHVRFANDLTNNGKSRDVTIEAKRSVQIQPLGEKRMDDNPNPWLEVRNRKNKVKHAPIPINPHVKPMTGNQRKNIIVGTNQKAGLQTVQKEIKLFTTRWGPHVEEPEVEKYLYERVHVRVKCEKLSLKSKYYSSFKITAWCNNESIFEDPRIWPEGAVVGKFYESRKRPAQEMKTINKSQV